jgi:hypothetical protein
MKWLLELFSVCDWISPAVGMAQDFSHAATGIDNKFSISVHKGDLNRAVSLIRQQRHSKAFEVISTNTVAFDDEALIDVPCFGMGRQDDYDSVREVMALLDKNGIHTWVYPLWA